MKVLRTSAVMAILTVAMLIAGATVQGADPVLVKDLGAANDVSAPLSNKGILYFPVLTDTKSSDGTVVYTGSLWQSDGTNAGTKKLYDFGAGTGIVAITTFKGVLYLGVNITTTNPDGSTTVGDSLYTNDGTAKGTKKIMDFGAGTAIDFLTPVKDLVYFSITTKKTNADGSTSSSGALWKTDGTAANTKKVKDFGADVVITGTQVNKGVLYLTIKTTTKNADGSSAVAWSLWKY